MLIVNNLTYKFRNKLLFNNITAEFNDGEIIGITGSAGSGKSTFITLMRNKLDYDGEIIIDDNNLKTLDNKKLKTLISHYSSTANIINPEAVVKDWI